MGKVLRRRSAVCCADDEAEVGLEHLRRGLEGGGARLHKVWLGIGTWAPGVERRGNNADRPRAPAEAVYAVHDALPNLQWGHTLYLMYRVPGPVPIRPSSSACTAAHFIACTLPIFR